MFSNTQLLNGFLSASFDGVLTFDQNFRVLQHNQKLAQLFDLHLDSAEAPNLFEMLPLLKPDAQLFLQVLSDESISISRSAYHQERLNHKAYYEMNVSPLKDQNGEIKGGMLIIKDVTDTRPKERSLTNKRLKDALKAYDFSNDRLKCIINNTQDLIVAIDPNFRFILFNDRYREAFEKFTGKRINLGVNLLSCLEHLPKEHKKTKSNWERVLQGEAYHHIDRVTYKDKSVAYYESSFNLVKDKDGHILGASQIMRNITDRVQTEELWIASEKRFYKMFNEAGVGFALWDMENETIVQTNPTLSEMLGYSTEELNRISPRELTHPDDYQQEMNLVNQLLSGETISYKMEKRVYHKKGDEIWVSVSGTLLLDSNNQPEYGLAIIENITSRRIAQAKLAESEEQNRTLISAFPDLIFLLDHEGRFIDFKSRQDEKNTPVLQVLGNDVQYLAVDNEVKQEILRRIQEAIEHDRVSFYEWEMLVEGRKRSYEARFLKSGQNHAVMVIRDISQRKQEELRVKELLDNERKLNQNLERQNEKLANKEEELAQANRQLVLQNESLSRTTQELIRSKESLKHALKALEERNFELDQFVYKTSHDLRSPLSSILGIVNLMKMDDHPDRVREYTERIESSVLRLDAFIQSMLSYSRNNRSEVNSEKIDYKQIINHCLDDLQYYKNFDKIRIDWQIEGEEVEFHSDPLRLKIVFNNIISNAIKYQDFSKNVRFISIQVKVYPDKTHMEFKDNGIGVEKEFLKDIYKMFYRATEEAEGSGLGLYIVKQTVDKLGGFITIESEGIGQGLRVKVEIPSQKTLKQVLA